MQNPRAHAPILEVLTAAGVPSPASRAFVARVSLPTRRAAPRTSSDSESDSEYPIKVHEELGRNAKVLSMVREEGGSVYACVPCGNRTEAAYGLAGLALRSTRSIGWDSNASGESGVIVHAT